MVVRAAVVCLLAVAGVVLAGVPGKERPHDAPAFQSVMTKTDSGCACKPWSRTIYNTSAAVSKLNNECADPEDEGSLWCFTEAPCATPTDTCTPPPQARNYEADGGASVVTFWVLAGFVEVRSPQVHSPALFCPCCYLRAPCSIVCSWF